MMSLGIQQIKYQYEIKSYYPFDLFGWHPHLIAIRMKSVMLLKYIIEKISQINPVYPYDPSGSTPLHDAAVFGQFETFGLIMELVKDNNPTNNIGITPLHNAALNNHLKICRLIIGNVNDKNPRCNLGNTPLHAAAQNGCFNNFNQWFF